MALADRDYMRDLPRQRGRTTRLDPALTDGVIWEALRRGSIAMLIGVYKIL